MSNKNNALNEISLFRKELSVFEDHLKVHLHKRLKAFNIQTQREIEKEMNLCLMEGELILAPSGYLCLKNDERFEGIFFYSWARACIEGLLVVRELKNNKRNYKREVYFRVKTLFHLKEIASNFAKAEQYYNHLNFNELKGERKITSLIKKVFTAYPKDENQELKLYFKKISQVIQNESWRKKKEFFGGEWSGLTLSSMTENDRPKLYYSSKDTRGFDGVERGPIDLLYKIENTWRTYDKRILTRHYHKARAKQVK